MPTNILSAQNAELLQVVQRKLKDIEKFVVCSVILC
jgi:hypothetical protein